MSGIPLYSVDPGEFSHIQGDTYYTELASHVLLKNVRAAALAGQTIPVVSNEDLVALDEEFTVGVNSAAAWFANAILETGSGTPRGLGSLVKWVPAAITYYTGGSPFWLLLIEHAIELLFKILESWLVHDSDYDFSDVAEILARGLLNEDGTSRVGGGDGAIDFTELIEKLEQVRLALGGTYDESLTEGLLQKISDLKEAVAVMLASFRLELDLESSQKSAAVSFTGVLAQEPAS